MRSHSCAVLCSMTLIHFFLEPASDGMDKGGGGTGCKHCLEQSSIDAWQMVVDFQNLNAATKLTTTPKNGGSYKLLAPACGILCGWWSSVLGQSP